MVKEKFIQIYLRALNHKSFSRIVKIFLLLVIGTLVGSALFLFLYGRLSIYFSHVNWLYRGGDNLQHQLGWEWFRQEPWRFPLGQIKAYGYPFGTFVTYMDSIPLMAIPFKLISPWLGQRFQYFGIWNLASVIGQVIFGLLILQEFKFSYLQKILGASLLVLSPPMIFRSFSHSSLTAHWILLAGIWLTIRAYQNKNFRYAWIILFAVALMIHIYFVPMLFPFWIISLIFLYSGEEKKAHLAFDIIVTISVLLFVGYSIGLFSLEINDLEVGLYSYHSWNVNGFLNPINTSSFFGGLPLGTNGQYEGYSYLGLGNLFLLPIALLFFLQKDDVNKHLHLIIPFTIISFLFALFSISSQGFLNGMEIWNIQLPNFLFRLFTFFRASGRFIWPVFYLLVLFGIISTIRNLRFPAIILAFALFLQIIDIQPLYGPKNLNNFTKYESTLTMEFWETAAATNNHIIIIPAKFPDTLNISTRFALFARQNTMTLNFGYFARGEYKAMEKYAEGILEELKSGIVNSDTIYVFYDSIGDNFIANYSTDDMLVCQIDGVSAILNSNNKITQTELILSKYCLIPNP